MKTINLIALLAFTALAAHASLIITLDNPDQTGIAGQQLSFTGVIQNTDESNTVYLNSFDLTPTGDDISGDGLDDFFANVPLSLSPGQTYSDIELFTITIGDPLVDPFGTYAGTYDLVGGANPPSDGDQTGSQDLLYTVGFSVTTAAPEPASFTMLAGGMLALGLFACSRFRSQRPTAPSRP